MKSGQATLDAKTTKNTIELMRAAFEFGVSRLELSGIFIEFDKQKQKLENVEDVNRFELQIDESDLNLTEEDKNFNLMLENPRLWEHGRLNESQETLDSGVIPTL